MTFHTFVHTVSSDRSVVAQFDRLRGTNLSRRGTGLDLAIDDTTGRTEHDCRLWLEFCADLYRRIGDAR